MEEHKKDLLKILEAAQKDSWCQECGVLEVSIALIKVLPKYEIEIPEWLSKRVED